MPTIQSLKLGPIRARAQAGPDERGRFRWRLEWYPPNSKGRMMVQAVGWLTPEAVVRAAAAIRIEVETPEVKQARKEKTKRATVASRLWRRVNKHGPRQPHMESQCWVWRGGTTKGYGMMSVGGAHVQAHRVAYELVTGKPCEAPVLMHRCDNPACVRPDHLQPGTQLENIHDAQAKGRMPKKKIRPLTWAQLLRQEIDELRAEVKTLRAVVATVAPIPRRKAS